MWGLFDRRRLVVARRWTGLGDCLISLTAAWDYARATGRTLAIDWRHSTYRTGSANLFDLLFEPVSDIGGVSVLSGDDVARHYRRRYWPQGWRRSAIGRAHRSGERGDLQLAIDTILARRDPGAATVVFDDCLASAAPSPTDQRRVFGALVPRPNIGAAIEAFTTQHDFGHRPVLGLHVRQGAGGHGPHWRSPAQTMFQLTRLIDSIRSRIGQPAEPLILLCTDSVEVEGLMRAAFPTLVTHSRQMRTTSREELHRAADAALGLTDAAVEMLLLARTDVLVRFPSGSFFSHWGAIMKPPLTAGYDDLVPSGLGVAIC